MPALVGGLWAIKSGDFQPVNFASTSSGIQAAIDYAGASGHYMFSPGTYTVSSGQWDILVVHAVSSSTYATVITDGTRMARLPLIIASPTFTETIDSSRRGREAIYSYVLATAGGTFGGAFNATHNNIGLELYSSTPTEAVCIPFNVINYARGDSGFAAGTSQVYAEGLCRGLEINAVTGNAQFQATLGTATTSQTTFSYSSPSNESTLGVGRTLIDISVSTSGTVASISGTTVTGSGTSWTSALIGQFFKMTDDDRTLGGVTASAWYEVTAVGSTTSLTIESSYGGTAAAGGAYKICPGAKVVSFDATANTITVEANSVAWVTGNAVQLRIHLQTSLDPFVGIVRRDLPFITVADGAFIAVTLGSETVGSAFQLAPGSVFDIGIPFLGTVRVGINAGGSTISSKHFMEIPQGKRITWGGQALSDSNPGLTGESDGSFSWYYGDTKAFSVSSSGDLSIYGRIKQVSIPILPDNTTPSVSNANLFYCSPAGATTITNFTNGVAGQRLTLIFTNGNATLSDSGNLKLSAAFTSSADDTMELVSDGSNWYELSRSVN